MAVIGVSSRDEVEAMAAFIEERDVGHFPHIRDDSGAIWSAFGVTSQPAFAFINDDGATETIVSPLGEETLTDRANALIAR